MTSDIAAVVAQIDADPDKLHSDSTPAAQALIEIGEPALPFVIPLLLSERKETRLRALRVIELVSMRAFGFEAGMGWRDEQSAQRWQKFWQAMGEPFEPVSEEDRAQLTERLTRWLSERATGKP